MNSADEQRLVEIREDHIAWCALSQCPFCLAMRLLDQARAESAAKDALLERAKTNAEGDSHSAGPDSHDATWGDKEIHGYCGWCEWLRDAEALRGEK